MPRHLVILAAILVATTAGAHDHRYALGIKGGVVTLTGGHPDIHIVAIRAQSSNSRLNNVFCFLSVFL